MHHLVGDDGFDLRIAAHARQRLIRDDRREALEHVRIDVGRDDARSVRGNGPRRAQGIGRRVVEDHDVAVFGAEWSHTRRGDRFGGREAAAGELLLLALILRADRLAVPLALLPRAVLLALLASRLILLGALLVTALLLVVFLLVVFLLVVLRLAVFLLLVVLTLCPFACSFGSGRQAGTALWRGDPRLGDRHPGPTADRHARKRETEHDQHRDNQRDALPY